MYLMFWSASKTSAKTCPVGALNAAVRVPVMKLVFSRQTYPSHSITTKNQARVLSHVLVTLKTVAKTGPVGALNAPVRAPIIKLVFCAKHVQSNPLHPKTKFVDVSHVLVSLKNQRENGPRRCSKSTRSCADYETCVFAPNISNPLHYTQKPSSGFISCFGQLQKPT